MGEYFGSSLCVIDLNSDGLDDLVIGAPQHSLETSNTLTDSGDEGRIYVFINNGNGNLNEIGDKHKITGSQQGARFGTAVSNVGDLNNDGYPDIAVGAPYENFGRGAVYIYHGQFDGIKAKFAQKILAQDIDNHIYGFGFSISRGSDSDGNNCLDVAVGAYDSGHVVLFRSLPVIKFYANLATNVRRINFDDTEFRAKACISYVGKYAPDSIEAEVTLKADPTYGRAVFILDSKNISLYVYKVKLKYGMEQCKEFGIEIIGSYLDFSKPIEILMQYNLTNSSQSGTDRRRTKNGFCKTCPILDPSVPSHVIHKVPYATGCKDDICKTDIKNYVSFVDFRSSSYVIGSSDSIQLKVLLKNTGDPAFLSYTNITFPSVIPLIRVPKNCKEISIASNTSDINGLQCEMGNPLGPYITKELILQFDTKNIPTNSDQITFNINSGSTGEELEMDDNIKEVILPLRAVSDISISGKSSQDHFYLVKKNETFSDKAVSFSHSYEIHNLGPSPVQKVNASFSIPYRITTPSGTVTLTKIYKPQIKIDSESSELFDCSGRDFSFFMDQKIGYESNFSIKYDITSERREIILEEKKIRRRKREIPSLYSIDKEKTVFINCSTVGVECVTVDCNLGPFKPTQTRANIILPFKVYPRDLESFLEYKDLILVSSTGSIEILDVPKPTKYDDKLYLGFFKRDKKEEMEKLKHKSEMEESLTANMSD
ncbi:hypothetical protein J437_LFUL008964 [Ladona fulva]|uniref:Uncharacterized protein n=1 Tax=Ladona fulva TaxID=123851 RepID=A0A8K0KFS2_LADFU|nr:hypothetical protein J437_LFUL008964 [Ladona fulva]